MVDKKDIVIDIPDDSTVVGQEVWDGIEEYITNGFLYSKGMILGKPFVIKSINHNEIKNINLRIPLNYDIVKRKNLHLSILISYGIFMYDGYNMLINREDNIYKLVQTINKLPEKLKYEIVFGINSLNMKASRLHPLVEFYVKENRSKYLWYIVKNNGSINQVINGIQGTDNIGLNYTQMSWIALNEIDDIKQINDVNWEHSKFVGSCLASDGVKQINEQERSKRQFDEQEFDDKRNAAINTYMRRKNNDQFMPVIELPDGRTAVVEGRYNAMSSKELAEQMRMALVGEKDYHDMMIQKYIEQKRAELNKKKKKSMASRIFKSAIDKIKK